MKNNILLFLTLVFFWTNHSRTTKAQTSCFGFGQYGDSTISQINIWGWAEKNKLVEIIPSWTKTKVSVNSDGVGKWKTTIKTPSAGTLLHPPQKQQGIYYIKKI